MTDLIDEMSEMELRDDRAASEADIRVCHMALACGVTHHKDGLPVQERLDTNKRIIEIIDAELAKRYSVACSIWSESSLNAEGQPDKGATMRDSSERRA
jgi:hypothetical protein